MNFTQEQKNIFDFVTRNEGHGIIDAVAGAGKTTTIMECAKYVKNRNSILFCAFNNSIAKEISQKFQNKNMTYVTVKTIHALGRAILQENNNTGLKIELNDNKYRELLENPDIEDLLAPIYRQILFLNKLNPDTFDEKEKFMVTNYIRMIKTKLIETNQKFRATLTKSDLEEFKLLTIHFGIFHSINIQSIEFNNEIQLYYKAHEILLQAGNSLSERCMIIDFTDMLYLPFIWRLSPSNKYEFLFIDECQDLSVSQFAIVTKYGKRSGRILAVGDPKQSIYGFTGADINSFNRVKEYTKAQQLLLTTCFRCPKKIIEMAKDIRDDIIGNKENSGYVTSITFKQIVPLAQPNDLIISRLKAPLVILVFDFIDKNIKVKIHEDEAKSFISELKRLFKQNELNYRIKLSPNGFENIKTTVKGRWKWIIQREANKINDITERNLYAQKETEYVEKILEFFHKKYELWTDDCSTIMDMLKKIKKYISAEHNAIRLSTIHRAKGLEENRVFILDYDTLPYFRSNQQDWEKTQEVNLKYVAITRAKEELFLVKDTIIEEIKEEGSLFDDLPFS